MKKHLLYVGTSLPTPGYGSSVIVYRHLTRLKGWKVTILTYEQEIKKEFFLPEDWQIIMLPECRKFWPGLKRKVGFLLWVRLNLLRLDFQHCLGKERPCAILNQLGKDSLLAYHLSKSWGVPLSIIVHDIWQVWLKSELDRYYMTDKRAGIILNHASRVWPASFELGKYYPVEEAKKVSVLFPIPEGNPEGFSQWKQGFSSNPVVGFAGQFHQPQLEFLKSAARQLQQLAGKLLVITQKNDYLKSELKGFSNIEYIEPFEKNSQLMVFLKSKVSGMLVCAHAGTGGGGWSYSFPSRLVEFMHLGVPVIIAASPNTALCNWAIRHNWLSAADYSDNEKLGQIFRQITEEQTWNKMAQEARTIAQYEFSSERIQAQFESELARG